MIASVLPATVFNNANQQINVYGDDVELDYRGYEVSGGCWKGVFVVRGGEREKVF